MTSVVSPEAQDAVGRAARRASERAADALATLVGQPLHSASEVMPTGRVTKGADGDEGALAVQFGVQGHADCELLAIFPASSIATVKEMLAPGMPEEVVPASGVALEVGNICASHFLNALGDLVSEQLLPSPPALTDTTSKLARGGPFQPPETFLIHTEFRAPGGQAFQGLLRFHLAPELVEALKKNSHRTV